MKLKNISPNDYYSKTKLDKNVYRASLTTFPLSESKYNNLKNVDFFKVIVLLITKEFQN